MIQLTWTVDLLLTGFPGTSNKSSLGMSSVALAACEGNYILLDTAGYGARGILLDALKNKNLTPDDISMVLISHLHFDHCANVDLFHKASIIFSGIEWEYAQATNDIYVQKAVIQMIKGLKIQLVDDGEEIVPGITAMLTPGHTPGSTTYLMRTKKGRIAFSGDAIKNRVELARQEAVMTYDYKLSRHTINKIRKSAKIVIPGHDCSMLIEGKSVAALDKNLLTISFQENLYANGSQSSVALQLDEIDH